jgi:hypothetical protein
MFFAMSQVAERINKSERFFRYKYATPGSTLHDPELRKIDEGYRHHQFSLILRQVRSLFA